MRHGLTQATLARRAATTQKQVSRIECGEISPSVATVARLLAALGEELDLRATRGPRGDRSDTELRADYEQLTASERVAQAAALSRTLTAARSGEIGPRSRVLQIEPLLGVLAQYGVDLVIVGGLALAAHGVIRGMSDLEVVPDPRRPNARRLADALDALNADLIPAAHSVVSRQTPVEQRDASRAANAGLRTRHGRLHVIRVLPRVKTYEALLAASVELEVPGAGVFHVCALDDLIALKAAAGRPQDRLDITSLRRARGGAVERTTGAGSQRTTNTGLPTARR